MIKKLALALLAVGFVAVSTQAAAPALDNAENPAYQGNDSDNGNDADPKNNTNGWVAGDNGGTGFTPWTFSTTGGGGRFIGDTAISGTDNSFGIFASNTGTNTSTATRGFGSSLLSGETFSLDLAATQVDAGSVGLNLLDNGAVVFTFFRDAGDTFWNVFDGSSGGEFATTINFVENQTVNFSFTYNGGSSYDLLITSGAQTYPADNFTATNAINNINGVRLFSESQGVNENLGFDNLTIAPIPEPSTLSLLAGPAILGAWFFVRRRRA